MAVGASTLLRLARVQTMVLTALTPLIGAAVFYGLSGDGAWSHWADLALLFAMGACLHLFGFVLNEWADLEVDRMSPDLRGKPLVSGDVSSRAALVGAVLGGLLGFLPLLMVSTTAWPLVMYAASLALMGIYDLWGKRAPLDHLLAGSLSALLLAGIFASGAFDATDGRHLSILLGLLGLQYLQNLFQNAIEGGIKDADHDAAAGARTFAVVTRTLVEAGRVRPSTTFLLAAWAMKGLHMGILVWMAVCVVGYDLASVEGIGAMAVVALSMVAMAATMARFLTDVEFDRPRLKRFFSAHEMATYMGTITIIVPLVGLTFAVALVGLPVVWFVASNIALYGRALEPGV
jgi:4-hydroxybenzoate polyprenyltransferase